ncbi:MAG: class I SAM-dependent DNA methyltransferase [Gemmataceae bacterium]
MAADWQLPAGVSRAVWDYTHDPAIAANYDASLENTPLLQADLAFVRERLPTPCRVIDLGCGTGRLAVPLARDGHDVVGVDLSVPMLQAARAKRTTAKLACANIVDLGGFRDAQFDAAICMFSTLGMIAGQAERVRVLREAHRLLKPSGLFLLHVHHLHHLLRNGSTRRAWFRDRLKRVFSRSTAGDFPMPAAPGHHGWTMHLFTRREIVAALRQAGFLVQEMRPIGVEGQALAWPYSRWAYGFLIACRKPHR